MPNKNMRRPRSEVCGTRKKNRPLANHSGTCKIEHNQHNHSLREEINALKTRIKVLERQGHYDQEEG